MKRVRVTRRQRAAAARRAVPHWVIRYLVQKLGLATLTEKQKRYAPLLAYIPTPDAGERNGVTVWWLTVHTDYARPYVCEALAEMERDGVVFSRVHPSDRSGATPLKPYTHWYRHP